MTLNVTDKLDLTEPFTCDRNALPFLFSQDGFNRQMIAHRLAAPLVHSASGRTDVGVVERGNVLGEKIDQPAFALKKREKLQRCIRARTRRHKRDNRSHDRGCRKLFAGVQLPDARRKGAVEDDAKPTEVRKPEARHEG